MLSHHNFRPIHKLGLLLFLAVTACSSLSPARPATPLPGIASTPTATVIPTTTPLPTFTETPLPTFTSMPTPTPTPPLLAEAGATLPPIERAITIETADQVSGLAEWFEPTVVDLAWTPDGRFLTVANSMGINFYDPTTRQILRSLYPQAEGIVDIAFSPTGTWLVSASRRGSESEGYASSMELWLGPDWKPMGILYGVVGAVTGISFTTDGRFMAAAYASPAYYENSVDIWNTFTWSITDTMKTGTALEIAFSPAERLLATSPDRYALRIWDMKEKQWLYRLPTSFTGAVNCLAFSPDGYTLASGHYDGVIRLWDMRNGDLILTIQSEEVIESLAFSPDGRLLASGGSFQNNQVRLWSAGSGALLRTLDGHTHAVSNLVFSPLGQYLASGSYDGALRLWGIRP